MVRAHSYNQWRDSFQAACEELADTLAAILDTFDEDHRVVTLVPVLRALDERLGGIFEDHEGRELVSREYRAHRIVHRRPGSFFDQYAHEHNLEMVDPLDHWTFADALDLQRVYVVGPAEAGESCDWEVLRVPRLVEMAWLRLGPKVRFELVSLPHRSSDIEIKVDESDPPGFTVRGFSGDIDRALPAYRERLSATLADGAHVIAFPELTDDPRLRQVLIEVLAQLSPLQVGLVLPGSKHVLDQAGEWRNRCTPLGPDGEELGLPYDKATVYPLPAKAVREMGHVELADRMELPGGPEVLEKIVTTPRKLIVLDGPHVGRIAFVICRDLLEHPIQAACRRHRLDHLFVLSMSPSLVDFERRCADLGREIGCGIYVVNAPTVKPRQARLCYVPIRGHQPPVKCKQGECSEGEVLACTGGFRSDKAPSLFKRPSS